MNTSMKQCDCRSIGLLVLRIGVGVILVMHGYGKLFGHAPGMTAFTGMVTGMGFPLPGLFAWLAALSEFVGGLALLLGVFTSVAAVFTAIVMLVALFMVKKFAFPMADPDLALLAGIIAIGCMGPGRYSLAKCFGMSKGCACCNEMNCATHDHGHDHDHQHDHKKA